MRTPAVDGQAPLADPLPLADGLPIRCLPREFHVFDPPAGSLVSLSPLQFTLTLFAGQTCQEWAGPFIAVAGGYLADGSVTSACQYCQVRLPLLSE